METLMLLNDADEPSEEESYEVMWMGTTRRRTEEPTRKKHVRVRWARDGVKQHGVACHPEDPADWVYQRPTKPHQICGQCVRHLCEFLCDGSGHREVYEPHRERVKTLVWDGMEAVDEENERDTCLALPA